MKRKGLSEQKTCGKEPNTRVYLKEKKTIVTLPLRCGRYPIRAKSAASKVTAAERRRAMRCGTLSRETAAGGKEEVVAAATCRHCRVLRRGPLHNWPTAKVGHLHGNCGGYPATTVALASTGMTDTPGPTREWRRRRTDRTGSGDSGGRSRRSPREFGISDGGRRRRPGLGRETGRRVSACGSPYLSCTHSYP